MRVVVLCFGNELIKSDKLPITLCKEFKNKVFGVDFVHCVSPNEILDYFNYDKVFILDTVKGIKDVCIIKNLDVLKERKMFTLHDFDLGFFLKLLKQTRKLENVEIIGIPFGSKKEDVKEKIAQILDPVRI